MCSQVCWPAASWHLTKVRLTVIRYSGEKGEGGVLKSTDKNVHYAAVSIKLSIRKRVPLNLDYARVVTSGMGDY